MPRRERCARVKQRNSELYDIGAFLFKARAIGWPRADRDEKWQKLMPLHPWVSCNSMPAIIASPLAGVLCSSQGRLAKTHALSFLVQRSRLSETTSHTEVLSTISTETYTPSDATSPRQTSKDTTPATLPTLLGKASCVQSRQICNRGSFGVGGLCAAAPHCHLAAGNVQSRARKADDDAAITVEVHITTRHLFCTSWLLLINSPAWLTKYCYPYLYEFICGVESRHVVLECVESGRGPRSNS